MSERKILIKDVCKLNSETVGSKSKLKFIQYLDTSNITRNKIDQVQLLDSDVLPFPSRAQRKVKKETIIYSTVRPEQEHFGFLENPPENLIVSTGFVTIDVVDQNINPKFFYYALTRKDITSYLQTVATNNVSSYPSINPSDLGGLELKIPSDIEIQRKISSVLSTLDAKIEVNNRINSQLEAIAKTLYDYWFVQFDFPNQDGKPYKSSGGKMLYNELLKREIPEGWKVKNFGAYAPCKGGYAFKSEWWSDKGLPVIKIKDINEDYTLNVSDFSYVEEDKYEKAKNFEAFSGDIIIAMTGATIGKFAIVPKYDKRILVNQRVGLFNLGSNPFEKLPFFINSMSQSYFREMVFLVCTGAAQPNISSDQIDSIPLLLPEKHLISDYNNKFISFYRQIINKNYENQQLTQLRDWLLPMLMNGQVKVS